MVAGGVERARGWGWGRATGGGKPCRSVKCALRVRTTNQTTT